MLVAQQVLQSLGLRSFLPQVTACPGCGRTTSTFFQEMAERHPGLPARADAASGRARYPGVEEMRVAVMGCVVNGPGESKHADIGISLPGTFEEPVAPVFVDGALRTTLRGEGMVRRVHRHPRRLRRAALRLAGGGAVIARIWRGATRLNDAEAYVEYMERTWLSEYRATPGNAGAWILWREAGDEAEMIALSFWESEDAIRGFAGDDISRAVFYPEDDRFLVRREVTVEHYRLEAGDGTG